MDSIDQVMIRLDACAHIDLPSGPETQRSNDRHGPSSQQVVGLIAVKLQEVESEFAQPFLDETAIRIDENTDETNGVFSCRANLAREIEVYIAGARRIEVEPDHVGAERRRLARIDRTR